MTENKKLEYTDVKTTIVKSNEFPYLFEQIYDSKTGLCRFVAYNPELKDNYVYKDEIIDSNRKIKYVPLCEESLWVKGAYLHLPDRPEDYKDFKNLVNEIMIFTRTYLDIPEDKRLLNAYVVILSWLQDKLQAIPYLRAIGIKGSGKTRFCDTYGSIAYKSIPVTMPNASNIFRLIDTYGHGTLVINEETTIRKIGKDVDINKVDVMTILCSGFEKGHPVPRSQDNNKKIVDPFDPFGLKILSGYTTTTHLAFESRCINTQIMDTDRNDIPIAINPKFEREAQHIRNMLLDFRLKNWNKDFSEFENQTREYWGKNISGRVAQCVQPISYLTIFDANIKNLLITIARDKHLEDVARDSETSEGKIFRAYIEALLEVNNTTITIKMIKEKFKDDEFVTPRSIASAFTKLNFETERKKVDNQINTYIVADKKLILKRLSTFFFPDEVDNLYSKLEKLLDYYNVQRKIITEDE